MTKRDVVNFLFKWKYTLVGYFLFVVAAVTLVSFVVPKKYEAIATLLVESNKAPAMRTDAVFGVEEMSVLISEIAIIRSTTVLNNTAGIIGVVNVEAGPKGAAATAAMAFTTWMEESGLKEPMAPHDALVRTLRKNLVVKPVPGSNVINISFNGKDPARIAKIVNTVTDSYIEHHLRVYSSAGTSEIYRLQVGRLNRELDALRNKLADYKRDTAVSAVSATLQALVRRENELATELAAAKQALAELQTRFGPGHTRLDLAAEEVESLMTSRSDNQAKLQSLEHHEAKIKEIELQIASVERSYQDYLTRYEHERLNELANPDVVNVRVIEYAVEPTRPTHSRIYYIALAAAGGFLLSFGIAFIKEYFDHRVTDQDVVAEILGVPTLGSIEKA